MKHFGLNAWNGLVSTFLQLKIPFSEIILSPGGQIKNDDNARDILEADLTQIHYLSGPIEVEGAEPGDVLEVEILDVQPLEGSEWGYTAIFDRNNGGCFLHENYPKATKAVWDFNGIYATSRHIQGVKFAGLIHPGIIGTAPSQELLDTWNKREQELIHASNGAIPPGTIYSFFKPVHNFTNVL